MRISLTVLLVASVFLASCGFRDSRINPRNWFGKSREVAVAVQEAGPVNPLIPPRRQGLLSRAPKPDTSVLMGTVTALRIEPTPTGAIVHASGVMDRQGGFNVRLVPEGGELTPVDGVLSFNFRVEYPRKGSQIGTEFSRTVNDAYSLSVQDLAGVRVVRVNAARNAQESRRR